MSPLLYQLSYPGIGRKFQEPCHRAGRRRQDLRRYTGRGKSKDRAARVQVRRQACRAWRCHQSQP